MRTRLNPASGLAVGYLTMPRHDRGEVIILFEWTKFVFK